MEPPNYKLKAPFCLHEKTNIDKGETVNMSKMLTRFEEQFGLTVDEEGKIVTSSLKVAECYGKEHRNVMAKIRDFIKLIPELNGLNFKQVSYIDAKGENRPMYEMDRQGFSILVNKFTGDEATIFTYRYTKAFEQMAEELENKRGQLMEIEGKLKVNGQLSMDEYNKIRFSEKRTVKTFAEAETSNIHQLVSDFNDFARSLDAETRIVRCKSAIKGIQRLHDNLAFENPAQNVGNCYNLIQIIDNIRNIHHIAENKRNGGLKAAQTKQIKRLQNEIKKVKPFEFEREGRVAGVYCIRNLENGCVYIGASKDVSRRLSQHRNALRENVHYNDDMQFDWNDYGEECFEFSVLDFYDDEEIYDRETEWIKSFDYLYNVKKNK